MQTIRRSHERGHAEYGWLDSYHTFSFADYHAPEWMGFRALRVLNEDRVMPGRGFATHPHRDMEIITYVLAGMLEHQDSMGNGRIISAGEAQYMAAGTGVTHSEFNPSPDTVAHFLQVWIRPDRQGVPPRYADRSFATSPGGVLQLVASQSGRDASIAIHQNADLWLARLDAGQAVEHRLQPGRHAWIHVAAGAAVMNGEALAAGDAIGVSEEHTLTITAADGAQVLVFDLV